MIPIILLNNVRRFASSFASVTNFFAQGSSRLSDSMATPQRGPPRKTVDALVALDRVRAEMLAGNVEVSAVTRPRGAIKADAASAQVIAFTIAPNFGPEGASPPTKRCTRCCVPGALLHGGGC